MKAKKILTYKVTELTFGHIAPSAGRDFHFDHIKKVFR